MVEEVSTLDQVGLAPLVGIPMALGAEPGPVARVVEHWVACASGSGAEVVRVEKRGLAEGGAALVAHTEFGLDAGQGALLELRQGRGLPLAPLAGTLHLGPLEAHLAGG